MHARVAGMCLGVCITAYCWSVLCNLHDARDDFELGLCGRKSSRNIKFNALRLLPIQASAQAASSSSSKQAALPC